MFLYTTATPKRQQKENNGKLNGTLWILMLFTLLGMAAYAAYHHNRNVQTIRSIRKEIRQTELRREELQKTLLNRENKLEELMDGGSIARLATPLGLRHPPHNQRVIPLKVCRTQEGRIVPITVGARR